MPNIKTIKPAGLGDYSTLATWYVYAAGQASADQWAECYRGNLGELSITGWTATNSATLYPRIYAAPGHRHNGKDATTGAYIRMTNLTLNAGIYVNLFNPFNYLRVEGIAAHNVNTTIAIPQSGFWMNETDHLLMDGCFANQGSVAGFEIYANLDGVPADVTLQNCIATNSLDTDIIIGAFAVVA